MSSLGKILTLVVVILGIGAGLVFWKSKVGAGHSKGPYSKVTKEELETIVKGLNPMQQRVFATNPEEKEKLLKNIKGLFAVASQAEKDGFAKKKEVKETLKRAEKEILAVSYDRELNKGKNMPPFSLIKKEQVEEFWGEKFDSPQDNQEKEENKNPEEDGKSEDNDKKSDEKPEEKPADEKDLAKEKEEKQSENKMLVEEPKEASTNKDGWFISAADKLGLGWIWNTKKRDREKVKEEFIKDIEKQIKEARERGQLPPEESLTDEQKKQFEASIKQEKERFARIHIYYNEAKDKLKNIGYMSEEENKRWEEFKKQVETQTKLQKAVFLNQLYMQEKIAPKLKVTEKEVEKYIEEHPELVKASREKAEKILKEAKEGADFAALAKKHSEDPGSKEQGGLYKDVVAVKEGEEAAPGSQRMDPNFEKVALSLEPGQVSDEFAETPYGLHIIKLEKKEEKEDKDGKKQTVYDVRHILIRTTFKDEKNPFGQEMPLMAYVNQKLQEEKREKAIAEIEKKNPVEMPKDFEITPPPIPQNPVQMPQSEDDEKDKPEDSKKETKEEKPEESKEKK